MRGSSACSTRPPNSLERAWSSGSTITEPDRGNRCLDSSVPPANRAQRQRLISGALLRFRRRIAVDASGWGHEDSPSSGLGRLEAVSPTADARSGRLPSPGRNLEAQVDGGGSESSPGLSGEAEHHLLGRGWCLQGLAERVPRLGFASGGRRATGTAGFDHDANGAPSSHAWLCTRPVAKPAGFRKVERQTGAGCGLRPRSCPTQFQRSSTGLEYRRSGRQRFENPHGADFQHVQDDLRNFRIACRLARSHWCHGLKPRSLRLFRLLCTALRVRGKRQLQAAGQKTDL